MWIIVTFDLPTLTPAQKKAYMTFRKFLLSDGFTMHQYSVYVRHCASLENTNVHEMRIRKNIPDEGSVSIIRITDKPFGNIVNLYGKKEKKLPRESNQLEIFLMMQKASKKRRKAMKKRKPPRKF
jgi:CRISPR-associated protein Cas2